MGGRVGRLRRGRLRAGRCGCGVVVPDCALEGARRSPQRRPAEVVGHEGEAPRLGGVGEAAGPHPQACRRPLDPRVAPDVLDEQLRQLRRVPAQPEEHVLLFIVPAQLIPAAAQALRLHHVDCADKRADRLEDVGRVDAVQPQKAVRRCGAGDLHGWAGDLCTSIQGGTVPLERAVVLAQPRRCLRRLARHQCAN